MKYELKPGIKSLFSFINPIRSVEVDKDKNYFYSFAIDKNLQDTQTIGGQITAYKYCAPLSGIIQRKAKSFNNGRIFLMDSNGKESTVAYAKKLRELMDKPNALQSWGQLINQLYSYHAIFGEVFLHFLKPVGFDLPEAVWVIPNWIMNVQTSGKIYLQSNVSEIITGYSITVNGDSVPLDTNSVLHIKDSFVNTDNILRGQSRMAALRDPISNIIAAYEARNVLITKRGAIGILSNQSKDVAGAIPLETKEKESLQTEFRKYGLSKEQSQVIITSASLSWQSMTFPTKDLMLFEEIEDDVRQIADNYEYPMYLLGFKTGTTFSNVSEAKKSLYQDSIIPEAESIYQAISNFLNTEKYGFHICVYYDHLEILQKSEKDKAEAFKILNEGLKIPFERQVISLEEYRLKLDMPEQIYGKTMYQGQPTPNITANGNG